MREYKFRGKRIDNGEWVYGDLAQYEDKHVEIVVFRDNIRSINYSVIPETVGQYTDAIDENKAEIYNGDIVEFRLNNRKNRKGLVEFKDNFNGFFVHEEDMLQYLNNIGDKKVIGNIYDNPDIKLVLLCREE